MTSSTEQPKSNAPEANGIENSIHTPQNSVEGVTASDLVDFSFTLIEEYIPGTDFHKTDIPGNSTGMISFTFNPEQDYTIVFRIEKYLEEGLRYQSFCDDLKTGWNNTYFSPDEGYEMGDYKMGYPEINEEVSTEQATIIARKLHAYVLNRLKSLPIDDESVSTVLNNQEI